MHTHTLTSIHAPCACMRASCVPRSEFREGLWNTYCQVRDHLLKKTGVYESFFLDDRGLPPPGTEPFPLRSDKDASNDHATMLPGTNTSVAAAFAAAARTWIGEGEAVGGAAPPHNAADLFEGRDPCTYPVSKMTSAHWYAMTDSARRERVRRAARACSRGKRSALYNFSFVFAGPEEMSLHDRLTISVMGLEASFLAMAEVRAHALGAPLREADARMIAAARDGDWRQVKYWVRRGADVAVRDVAGGRNWTALLHAAACGQTETVRCLVTTLGAQLADVEPIEGRGALHLAAAGGHTPLVRALVEELAVAVDVVSRYGRTPLHDAAALGQTDTVAALLRLNASVSRRYAGTAAAHPLGDAVCGREGVGDGAGAEEGPGIEERADVDVWDLARSAPVSVCACVCVRV